VSCKRFGFCRLEDVTSFVLRTPQHTIGGSLVQNPILPTDDPVNGYRWAIDMKYGHAEIGKTLPIDFGRVQLEATTYRPLGERFVLALRGQVGAVVAPADRSFLLPPAERFYGGGQNSVRGFGQNLLGPGSYIVDKIDTVVGPGGTQVGQAIDNREPQRMAPSGGNAMWIANFELRTRHGWPIEILRWVAFVDVGRVWNTTDVFSVTNADARATPGLGIRLLTPLGPFRLDVGYNPNTLEPGPAFLVIDGDPSKGTTGRAICVSRGSDDPLMLGAGQSGSSNSCPATYLPPKGSMLSRFTFHFSLGNAF
jgi:outer membrane protein insertion porin family/translocation and assembly module TamA